MYSLAEVDNPLPPEPQLSALSTEAAAGPLDSQYRASSLWEKCFISHCKSPEPSPTILECTWTCLPKPGKGRGRGEKLDSLTPAFFAKEATVNIVLNHHKDLVETELRTVLGLGKLLSQEKSTAASRVSHWTCGGISEAQQGPDHVGSQLFSGHSPGLWNAAPVLDFDRGFWQVIRMH